MSIFNWWCSGRDDDNKLYRYIVDENDEDLKEYREFMRKEHGIDVDTYEFKGNDEIFKDAWLLFRKKYRRYYGYKVKIEKMGYINNIINEVENTFQDNKDKFIF